MPKQEEHTALAYEPVTAPDTDTLDLGILDDFIGMHLRVAYEVAYDDFAWRLGDVALRPGYFTILTLIVRNPRISQTQIGLASSRDKSSINNALRWMEDNGYVTRLRSAHDRRTHLSVATDKGRALQAEMEAKATAHIDVLNAAIGPGKRDEFVAQLKRLIETLRQAQTEANTEACAQTR
jgi:DNA-binding MarR family transcriptional regulator